MLLVKMRAGATKKEQAQAASLLPIVRQHHLLLVTLLLLNSISSEAMPLYLKALVSPLVAVVLSVALVLFFGEIIPSAVFTGPKKIEIASKLTPLVRFVMVLLWPIAFPIAKMLDYCLHDEEEESTMDLFNRGELSALVRIQYEERMAAKLQRKREMAAFRQSSQLPTAEHIGGLDFSPSTNSTMVEAVIRASKRDILRHQSTATTRVSQSMSSLREVPDEDLITRQGKRSVSIHIDEVAMIEGALQMKTKMAMDVFTPLHRMRSIPYDMILNERNVVSIYSSGFSRIPVFEHNPQKPKSCAAIRGILMTKSLIVVNPNEDRPLATLPLYTPLCVSPKMNLVDLLNLFQTGRKGHLALVCARPMVAEDSLNAGHTVPEAAGFMGYVRGLDGNYFL
jgi:metal transporter CNNM